MGGSRPLTFQVRSRIGIGILGQLSNIDVFTEGLVFEQDSKNGCEWRLRQMAVHAKAVECQAGGLTFTVFEGREVDQESGWP